MGPVGRNGGFVVGPVWVSPDSTGYGGILSRTKGYNSDSICHAPRCVLGNGLRVPGGNTISDAAAVLTWTPPQVGQTGWGLFNIGLMHSIFFRCV